MAGPTGLQQLLRMQGLEWGDSGRGGGDYHLWFDGGSLNTDASFSMSSLLTLASGITFSGAVTTIQAGATELRIQSPDTLTRQVVVNNNGVGIGGAYPGAGEPLWVGKTITDPAAESGGASFIVQYAATTNNTQILHGGTFNPRTQTTDTNNFNILDGLNIEPWVQSLSGTITEVKGIWCVPAVRPGSGANVTAMNGIISQPSNSGTGVITTMNGFLSQPILSASAGNVTTARSYYSQVQNNNASATITTGIGYYAQSPIVTGPITTTYGIYITDQGDATKITTSYGLYIEPQTQSVTLTRAIDVEGGQVYFRPNATIASATAAAWDGFKVSASTLTITGNTGSPITQLNLAQFNTPIITDASAVTVSVAATVAIQGAPTASGSVTITSPYAFLVSSGKSRFSDLVELRPTTTTVSASGTTWNGFAMIGTTLTLTGGVNVTTPGGVNFANIVGPTITSASATTVTNAATVALVGPPVAGGSVTLTNAVTLWVDSQSGAVAGGGLNAPISFGVAASAPSLGIRWGSGAPTISAPKGSLYLRTDGTTTNDRAYINTNGSTTWTNLTTGA